jgi:medium-chain acyl-[acyl-carrier-protein] hydrolase
VSVFDSWILSPRPNAHARLRLFCFSFAGGHAGTFRRWAELLPDSIQVCAVQLPGRQRRIHEPPFLRMEPLVDTLAEVLRPFLERPFAIFGNCTGSLIGFELARRLTPRHLFVSCCRAPQLPDLDPPIHALPDEDVRRELDRMGGTPPELMAHPELLTLLLPTLRSDFELAETYAYRDGAPLACPLTVFGGRSDSVVTPAQLEAWRQQTSNSFALHMVEGGHYLLEPASAALCHAVAATLEMTDA